MKNILGYLIIISILAWIRFSLPELSHPILDLSVLGIFVFSLGKVFGSIRLPVAMGFIVGGIICGPYVTGFIPEDGLRNFPFFYELCLFWTVFRVGLDFRLSRAELRSAVFSGAVAGITFVLVSSVMYRMGFPGRVCFACGAIASAFSPLIAFGAGGGVTAPVWGIAWNMILFYLALGSAGMWGVIKVDIILTFIGSIIIGLLVGRVLDDLFGFTASISASAIISSGAFLSAIMFSSEFGLCYPIVAFSAGAAVSNFGKNRESFLSFSLTLAWISLAFVLGAFGSEVDLKAVLSSFKTTLPTTAAYVALMVAGKGLGMFFSLRVFREKNWALLSRSLLPQSVFAIWLLKSFPEGFLEPRFISVITTGILFSSLILPLLTALLAGLRGFMGEVRGEIFPRFRLSKSSEGESP